MGQRCEGWRRIRAARSARANPGDRHAALPEGTAKRSRGSRRRHADGAQNGALGTPWGRAPPAGGPVAPQEARTSANSPLQGTRYAPCSFTHSTGTPDLRTSALGPRPAAADDRAFGTDGAGFDRNGALARGGRALPTAVAVALGAAVGLGLAGCAPVTPNGEHRSDIPKAGKADGYAPFSSSTCGPISSPASNPPSWRSSASTRSRPATLGPRARSEVRSPLPSIRTSSPDSAWPSWTISREASTRSGLGPAKERRRRGRARGPGHRRR